MLKFLAISALIVTLALLAVPACNPTATTAVAVNFDGHATNAATAALKAHFDPNCPEWTRSYLTLNQQAWEWAADWSHGRPPRK